jgi:hypothetical protein
MKMNIKYESPAIDVLGRTEPVELWSRDGGKVYLDGQRAPQFIEEAILFYLDVKGLEYLHRMKDIKKD